MAVSVHWGSFEEGFRAPSRALGVDIRRVERILKSLQKLGSCFWVSSKQALLFGVYTRSPDFFQTPIFLAQL